MDRSGDETDLKLFPLLRISLLSSSTFHIMTNTRSRLRCGPKSSPLPTFWPPCPVFLLSLSFFSPRQAKPPVFTPFLHHPFLLPWFFPPLSSPISLPLPLSGLPECSGADHELCPWHVVPLASGAACAVYLRPHGIFTQHQWPHRLCHSGGGVGEMREEGVCAVQGHKDKSRGLSQCPRLFGGTKRLVSGEWPVS